MAYKVDNAVIMAAGTASRFAPLSFERPKALIEVKGEVLIERQIRRNKTRLEKRLRTAAFVELPPMEDVEEEPEFTIRRKSFPVRPMSPEEAILQMNLSDHNFFIFKGWY